jgi:MFS family permease
MAGVARTAEGLRGCPGFGPFWAAATVSSFGTYITTLAVQVLVVLTLRGGAADVGLVSAARWLPYLLFGVFAGVFVDRARRRPILVTTDFVRCVLLVAIPTLAVAHHLSLVVLVAFMVVFGLASLANDAASQSFLPRLVPPRLLTRANARLDQSDAVALATSCVAGSETCVPPRLSARWRAELKWRLTRRRAGGAGVVAAAAFGDVLVVLLGPS